MTEADINAFDTFTDRSTDQAIDRERFFKYLLGDKIADQGMPTQTNYTDLWASNFNPMFAQNYANSDRSNLYDVAFNNASVSGSKKYSDMFFDMFNKKPTNLTADPGYTYANTLANTSTGIASSTKVDPTVKEVYINNLKSSFEYDVSDQMARLLERQINASYETNKVFSSEDLAKFQTLFEKNATTQQQDLLFKAISEGKDPLVFEHMGKKFGISICEDIWASQNLVKETHYSHHPFDHYKDVDAMINISASPYVKNKFLTRFDLLQKVAKKYKAPIFYSCQVGGQDGVLFDGGSFVVNQRGEFVDHLQFFKEDEKVFDLNNLIKGDLPQFPIFEEIENAIIMGLRDFFYKQGFKGCLVGLSGGIDSSLTLYLCVKAFGAQSVYGFMIPSLFTSDMNIEDSTKLAKKLNVEIKSAPLGKVLTELEEMVKAQTSYQLKDLTHQNMQARLRGLFLMAMSNQTDHLVITTGNKSELAMGYATLYGDMCGAIAPLGDLLKTEVYGLAKHIQSKEEIFPKRIFIKAPSAELAFNQKDEDNLPPYPVLDQILSLFLEQGYSIEKIIEMTKIQREVVTWVIHKLFQMEFKRQQYAPVLKVSSKTFNLGRKMPIVQKFYKSNF
ncbi:MAG: NAD(+) synthase [Chlamydiae bacterium]|nr:NAD(+) synthase [Chlamydiota bacterium]